MTQPVSEQRPAETLFTERVTAPVRAQGRPSLAVVLASRSDIAFLRPALPELAARCAELGAQLMVVRPGESQDITYLEREIPGVKVVRAGVGSDLRELRVLGAAQAAADVTVLLDDRLTPMHWEQRLAGVLSRFGALSGREGNPPSFSVILSAHQAADRLPATLSALDRSDVSRESWELIVVDDASMDDTRSIAVAFADVVVRLPGRQSYGPAYARNRGAEVARGEILVFIDSDVRVRHDTLSSFQAAFAASPDATAVIGCYDAAGAKFGLVSDYRTLLHRYLHQRHAGTTHVFWGGCGAVRREAFQAAGGYDEWTFNRPQVEDVELGHRLRAIGGRIIIAPSIQATNLKRWTLATLLARDIWDQSAPWMRVVSGRVAEPTSPVVHRRTREHVSAALAWLGAGAMIESAIRADARWLLLSVLCVIGIIASNGGQLGFFLRARGLRFTLISVALSALCSLVSGAAALTGWLLRHIVGEPTPDAVTQAYFEVGMQQWPPVRAKRSSHVAPTPPVATPAVPG